MQCVKCQKDISDLLCLFDGTLVCPQCGDIIVNNNIVFKVNEDNDEIFEIAEIAYYQYLVNPSANLKYLEKATRFCQEAASLGHPKAYYLMGYFYDKDLIDKDKDESFRTKIAYEYYSALCYSESSGFINDLTKEKYNFAKLRTDSANMMLKMLSNASIDAYVNQKYSVDYNYKKCISCGLKGLIKPDDLTSQGSLAFSRVKTIFDTLVAASNNKSGKSPILGIYKIKASELKDLLVYKTDGGVDLINVLKSQRIEFAADKLNVKKLTSLNTQSRITHFLDEDLNDLDDDAECVFTFRIKNNNGVKNKKVVAKFFEKLFQDGNEVQELFYNNNRIEFVFYEDDALFAFGISKKSRYEKLLKYAKTGGF